MNEDMFRGDLEENDLDFMCHLESSLPACNLTETALTTLNRHLWYVSEEMIGFGLFRQTDQLDREERYDSEPEKALKK